MKCRVAAFSRTGGREQNEDACGYMEKDGVVCCVLADGAGGHRGGGVAARLCVQSVLAGFETRPEVSVPAVSTLMHQANQAVLLQQETDTALSDMRSTLVVLLFDPAQATAAWGHIGDSRLYLFRAGALHLRTRDHSLVQSMIENGLCREEEAHSHPDTNVLFASVGLPDEFLPTIVDAPLSLQEGDVFLLCSDGVWGMVEDGAIERSLALAYSLEDWLSRLEQKVGATVRPGADNFSAIGVWCGEVGECMRTVPGPG